MQQAGQQIQEIALRIREMRNIMGYSTEEMSIRTQVDEKTVAFDSDDWLDCLKFFHWVL